MTLDAELVVELILAVSFVVALVLGIATLIWATIMWPLPCLYNLAQKIRRRDNG